MIRGTRLLAGLCWVLAGPFLLSGSALIVTILRFGDSIALPHLPGPATAAVGAAIGSVWLCVGVACMLLPYALPVPQRAARAREVGR